MKKRYPAKHHLPGALLALCLLGMTAACDDLRDQPRVPDTQDPGFNEFGTAELYVLCEGLFNLNNSTLARYSFTRQECTRDYFRLLNRRGLGDTANDMAIYGSKLYVVVNVSGTVEVIDLQSGLSVRQIALRNENGSSRQPRAIAFEGGKAYVCSYDGSVARIDTASLETDGLTWAGRNPEDICCINRKLYVSNSGGLDWEGIGTDNTVSVIDLRSFRETARIEVGHNPGKIVAASDGNVYVVTRGRNLEQGDHKLVRIDPQTDAVTYTLPQPVLNFAVNDNLAYLYNYDYQTQESRFMVYNLAQDVVVRDAFITDGTRIHTPYAIEVNPYSGNVYLTDAYNYQVAGDLLCFSPQGQLISKISQIGMNPNTVLFRDVAAESDPSGDPEEDERSGAFADRVLEYVPAPGQFANTTATAYKDGFDADDVLRYANEMIRNRNICLLSLGAWGGYITVGFDHPVRNVPDAYDLKIYGNAYYDMYGTALGKPGGSSEPGIVLVSKDSNGNGLSDDVWYELAGSEYYAPETVRDYEVTYFRPEAPGMNVRWQDNQGNEGEVKRISTQTQDYYYPLWMPEQVTFRGSRLAPNSVNEPRPDDSMPEHWVGYAYDYGYADNHPNNTPLCEFKLEWAVDAEGRPVELTEIDFVRIYTAVQQNCGWIGETSTEVNAVEDLNFEP